MIVKCVSHFDSIIQAGIKINNAITWGSDIFFRSLAFNYPRCSVTIKELKIYFISGFLAISKYSPALKVSRWDDI